MVEVNNGSDVVEVVVTSQDQAKAWRLKLLKLWILTRPIRILAEPLVFFTDLILCYKYFLFFCISNNTQSFSKVGLKS